MLTPTAGEVRERSPLLRQRYPAPAASGTENPDLLAVVEDAAVVVAELTGRLIAPYAEGEEVPAGLVGVAVRAVARMAELMDTEAASEFADVAARGRRLRGFSAGPYSETYFAPGDLVVAKGSRPQMSPDPTLDRLLWALATEAKREEWIALVTGVQPPAGAVAAFDYRRMGGGGGIRHGSGPDGW